MAPVPHLMLGHSSAIGVQCRGGGGVPQTLVGYRVVHPVSSGGGGRVLYSGRGQLGLPLTSPTNPTHVQVSSAPTDHRAEWGEPQSKYDHERQHRRAT